MHLFKTAWLLMQTTHQEVATAITVPRATPIRVPVPLPQATQERGEHKPIMQSLQIPQYQSWTPQITSYFLFLSVSIGDTLCFSPVIDYQLLINQIHIGSCFFNHNSHNIGAGGLKSLLNYFTPVYLFFYLSKAPFGFHKLLITNQ